ncbi:MAG: enoyl-CoA hydratase/isomerase family protein [Deltaproteobacteria bacterium]|nr:enoyl-CoA hydratase/isomerase family protein [Deltaproteobacteria bacterium]
MRFLSIEEIDRVAVVAIRRVEKKNALSMALLEELGEAARGLSRRVDIHAVVLAGGGDFFTAGMDLADPELADFASLSLSEKRRVLSVAPDVCRAWEEMEPYTVCAIEGYCLGGGVSLAVSTDCRVMAESAVIRAPEIPYGMNMSWGTLPRLLHLVGPARTKELILFAEDVDARTAYEWGFAQAVCPDGQALSTALALAQKAARHPRHAVAMTKKTINALSTALDSLASHMDHDQFLLTLSDPETMQRILDFFGKK